MTRKASHSPASRRSRKSNTNGSSRFLYVCIALCAVAVIGIVVWLLTRQSGYLFQRAHLDKYIEITKSSNTLGDGASVYVDMSDGMNYAYATPESQSMLQAIINKLAANRAIEFFELSDAKIIPLDKSHTELYNYMLNSKSYNKQKAPIETVLNQIVSNRQPALLMTDFEEYKGKIIEKAAYAKKYFIDWLASGYNITFYKWDFIERGKAKHMFLAVFDDNSNRLKSLVENAVRITDPNIETYVLGSREFAYPTSTQYLSLKQGGNYHNNKGKDVVTAVLENSGINDYICYAKPFATATGVPGQFAPLDISFGTYAEYYPLGVKWTDAIENAKRMQEPGISQEDKFTHLFRNLFIDFDAQDGFSIGDIEIRVFDMQNTMRAIGECIASGDSLNIKEIESINKPEINMVLTAGMESDNLPSGWKEIYVDFDNQFNGTFMGGIPSTNLVRANIVISKVTPEISKAISFFGWDGNPSLSNSVKETLTAASSNPQGRILFTYYIKTISE